MKLSSLSLSLEQSVYREREDSLKSLLIGLQVMYLKSGLKEI